MWQIDEHVAGAESALDEVSAALSEFEDNGVSLVSVNRAALLRAAKGLLEAGLGLALFAMKGAPGEDLARRSWGSAIRTSLDDDHGWAGGQAETVDGSIVSLEAMSR